MDPCIRDSTRSDLTRLAVASVPAHQADGVLTALLDSPDVDAPTQDWPGHHHEGNDRELMVLTRSDAGLHTGTAGLTAVC